MSNSSRRKRPCGICRKWFRPDVRQKGRQKTCSPECRRELHRRQCENWNKKNRDYFKSNYLSKKLEKAEKVSPASCQDSSASHESSIPECRRNPILPRDIVLSELGTRNLIIIEYLFEQIMDKICVMTTGFT